MNVLELIKASTTVTSREQYLDFRANMKSSYLEVSGEIQHAKVDLKRNHRAVAAKSEYGTRNELRKAQTMRDDLRAQAREMNQILAEAKLFAGSRSKKEVAVIELYVPTEQVMSA